MIKKNLYRFLQINSSFLTSILHSVHSAFYYNYYYLTLFNIHKLTKTKHLQKHNKNTPPSGHSKPE